MRTAGQYQQCFNCIGYLCANEPIVTVPLLPFDIKQPPLDEFGEVSACRLGRDVGSFRQLPRRQSEAIHQSQRNCGSSRIAQQARATRQFLFHGSIISPNLFECYGPQRTIGHRLILCPEAFTLITLFLGYTIDPHKLSDIAKYAADEQVPVRESGKILGYFMPIDFAGATS